MAQFDPLNPIVGLPSESGKVAGFSFVPQVRKPQATPSPLRPSPPLQNIQAAGAIGETIARVATTVASVAIEARDRRWRLDDLNKLTEAKFEYNEKLEASRLEQRQAFKNDPDGYEKAVKESGMALAQSIAEEKDFRFGLNREKFNSSALQQLENTLGRVASENVKMAVSKWVGQEIKLREELLRGVVTNQVPLDQAFDEHQEHLDGGRDPSIGAIMDDDYQKLTFSFAAQLREAELERDAMVNLPNTIARIEADGYRKHAEEVLNLTDPKEKNAYLTRYKARLRARTAAVRKDLAANREDHLTRISELGVGNPQYEKDLVELDELEPGAADKAVNEEQLFRSLFSDKISVWTKDKQDGQVFVNDTVGAVKTDSPDFASAVKRREFVRTSFQKKWELREEDPAKWADTLKAHQDQETRNLLGEEPVPLQVSLLAPDARDRLIKDWGGPGPILTRTKTEMDSFLSRVNSASILDKGQLFLAEQAAVGVDQFSRNFAHVNKNAIPVEAEFLANISMFGAEGMQAHFTNAIDLMERSSGKSKEDLSKAASDPSKIVQEATNRYNEEIAAGFPQLMDHESRREFLVRLSLQASAAFPEKNPVQAVDYALSNSYGKLYESTNINMFGNIVSDTLKSTIVPKTVISRGQFRTLDKSAVAFWMSSFVASGKFGKIKAALPASDRATVGSWRLRLSDDGDGFEIMNGQKLAVIVDDTPIKFTFDEILDNSSAPGSAIFDIWERNFNKERQKNIDLMNTQGIDRRFE